MNFVWEYHIYKDENSSAIVDDNGILSCHAHPAYAGKQRVTILTSVKPANMPEAKMLHLHVLEEIEPMWYFLEAQKTTFRVIKRCTYCNKYFVTEHAPVLGDRYLIKPKFNAAKWSPTKVQTIFPEHLKQHDTLIIEYRPAEPDEDNVIVDLNGKELKFAVVRAPVEDEKYVHHTCILRKELCKTGEEYYLVLDEFCKNGGRFYYYPYPKTIASEYPNAGTVKNAPGTWAFNIELSEIKKYQSKYQIFTFMHKDSLYAGFFN